MRCQAESVDHSACPPHMGCIADPAAVLPEHAKSVEFTQCEREAAEGEKYCSRCLEVFGGSNGIS